MVDFKDSRDLSVGVEEELLLLDRSNRLMAEAEAILDAARLPPERLALEVYASQIELRSSPSMRISDIADELVELQSRVKSVGARLCGIGIHPLAEFGDAQLVSDPRYETVAESVGGLVSRTPEAALHVHIGVSSGENAVRLCNAMREELPLLIALSANSPWWFGRDSGLQSARYSLVRPYPRRGLPPIFHSYDHYCETIGQISRAANVDDYTYLWWDIRLHPRLGTLEIRELDAQFSIVNVAAITSFIQALAYRCLNADHRTANLSNEVLLESCFRASRDGLHATIYWDGYLRPIREIIDSRYRELLDAARDLGNEDSFAEIEAIVANGNSADILRRQASEGGLHRVLDFVVGQTMGDLS